MMKVKIVWQGNAISCMKSFGILNCSLCMRERIEILRTILQNEEWKIINHCNEIYDACWHKTRFHRFLKEHTNVKNTSTDEGAISQKRSTSMTIETDLVIRTILRNHHLVRRALPTSPHLQVRLTSVRRSSCVHSMIIIQ